MDDDRFERIKAKPTDFWHTPSDLCVTPDDVDWLVEEVESLRALVGESCGCVGL